MMLMRCFCMFFFSDFLYKSIFVGQVDAIQMVPKTYAFMKK